jgi:hypothetical protein
MPLYNDLTGRLYGLPVTRDPADPTIGWVQVTVPEPLVIQTASYAAPDSSDYGTIATRQEWRLVCTSTAQNTTSVTVPANATAADVYQSVASRYLTTGEANNFRLQYTNNYLAGAYGYGLRDMTAEWTSHFTTDNLSAWAQPKLTPAQARKLKNDNRRKEIAIIRARRLMREHLTVGELDQLEELGYFEVRSSSGRTYRIYKGHSRNVVELDAHGREINRLCAYSRTGSAMPDEDHMVIQKLMLETDEAAYRKVANHSPIHQPAINVTITADVTAATEALENIVAHLGQLHVAA